MSETDLLADLNESQRDAVTTIDGPLLILAGAGSGKTRVITRRVAYLLHVGVHPANVLAITFTNKAAGEMRQRIESLVPGHRTWISTFHAMGARLLRQYADRLGLDKDFTIYDQTDRTKVVKIAMEDAQVSTERFTPESIMNAISKAKNLLLSPDRYTQQARDFFTLTVAKVYPIYEKRLHEANALDFDDLLYWPALALKHDTELRSDLDARFRYVLIDEYQDTNQAQYQIARRLSMDHPNLCVVGDPDQCLPPGTLVDTPRGKQPIETLREGERVLSATGWGGSGATWIDKVMCNPYKGKLVTIRVEGGHELRATPNHVCFASDPGVREFTPALCSFSLTSEAQESEASARVNLRTPGSAPWSAGIHSRSFLSLSWRSGESEQDKRAAMNRRTPEYAPDRLTAASNFRCCRADQLRPGMIVPVLVDGQVTERRIESVSWQDYDGPVYDLSIPETHNFAANNVVVHNSIYKFRGSDIRNILDFERDFPQAKVLTLSLNYRSTKSILAAASGLIAHNLQRKPKDLLTENTTGQKVTLLTFHSGTDEAAGVARRISEAVKGGKRRFRDHAILVRVNALTRGLEQAMIAQRVPFQIVRGLAFFDRKENRDVLAYIRLLLNPRDDVSFDRIVNEPARGIGATSLAHLKAYAADQEISLLTACGKADVVPGLKGKAVKALRDFHQMMHDLAQYTEAQPDELIRQVLDRTGYRKMLKDSRDEEDQQRLANIEELITAAGQFASEDNRYTVRDWLENITLSSDIDGYNEEQDCVAIMTMHAAKGLEFPCVFLIAVEMGILPHQRAMASQKQEEIEEERRLMFVGMTRAKEELYLTHARGIREFRGQDNYPIPSRFLDELPTDVLERVDRSGMAATAADRYRGGSTAAIDGWRDAGMNIPLAPKPRMEDPYPIGSRVRHESYGDGMVLGYTGFGGTRAIKVRFQTQGERTFRLSHVQLVVL